MVGNALQPQQQTEGKSLPINRSGTVPLDERRVAAASAATGIRPPAAPLHSPSAQAAVANYLHSINTMLEKVSASNLSCYFKTAK